MDSFIFSSTFGWCCYAILARSQFLELIYFPVIFLRQTFPPHPPDSPLLSVLTLVRIFGVHLSVLIYGLWSVLHTCLIKLWLKAKNYFPRIKFGWN